TSITKQNDFQQAGEFYDKLQTIEKEHLAENLASDLKVISDDIREIVLGYFNQVSTDLKTSIETKMKEH
ncbi:catalase-related domain-containing protein, partial [Bacillus luti]|uniref:catalase-related domain-containing protein n=1 Tax=Bacillus luti TaxID=2026191 RepID=UPI002899AF63